MSRGRVLLTGATGFIGSHLAEALLQAGYEVLALRRASSALWRLQTIQQQLAWVDTDQPDWEAQVAGWQPEILVHSAWLGVSAGQRDDWHSQLSNLDFTLRLLQLVAQGPIRKVVALGSQAEYGLFHGRIDEQAEASPNTAYGAVKLATLQVLKAFCQAAAVDWYWLRVFAVFGPREDRHWFVSHVVHSLLAGETTNLSGCEQRYDYLYVKDLARSVVAVLAAPTGNAGVYNLSSNTAVSLKTLVLTVQELIGSQAVINFGALPYRPGQVMHMEGNSDRLEHVVGPISQTPLAEALTETIDFARETFYSEPREL